MADYTKPTSEWQHSHALDEGDELETEHNEVWQVVRIMDDGAINVRRTDGDHGGPEDNDTWSEEAVRMSLAHEEMHRVSDGLGHELATF